MTEGKANATRFGSVWEDWSGGSPDLATEAGWMYPACRIRACLRLGRRRLKCLGAKFHTRSQDTQVLSKNRAWVSAAKTGSELAAENWSKPAQNCEISADFGRNQTRVAQCRRKLAEIAPELAHAAESWLGSRQNRPGSPKSLPNRPNSIISTGFVPSVDRRAEVEFPSHG